MKKKNLLHRATLASLIKIFSRKALWKSAVCCLQSIFSNFFVLQSFAVLFPGRVKVTSVDHPLDNEIPFKPNWVHIYMDFSAFWIRVQGFLLKQYGREAAAQVNDFLDTVTGLYRAASSISRRNFSTTHRPRYYGKFKFIVIHLFDPHLMCIPSLHVMLVLCTFAKFKQALAVLDRTNRYETEITWARNHALLITESILYVKQHSVNCIPAALYTMNSLDSSLFDTAMINEFINDLFAAPDNIAPETVLKIKQHINDLYARFTHERQNCGTWQEPLMQFLKNTGTG